MTYDEYMNVVQENVSHFLSQGKNPWQSPWRTAQNGVSERPYGGINAQLLTMVSNRYYNGDPRFYTYEQAIAKGYKVKKGEHAYPAYFFKTGYYRVKKDEQGNELKDENGEPIKELIQGRPMFTTYNIFNAGQLIGVPKYKPKAVEANVGNLELATDYVSKSPVKIIEDQLNAAFFRPSTDDIHIPKRESFKSDGDYFSTVFHEMSHSTGVPGRLCRESFTSYTEDRHQHAKEELVAELTAVLLCDKTGYRYANKNSAAYIESWSKLMRQEDFNLGSFYREVTQSANYLTLPEERTRLHDLSLKNTYFDKLKSNPIQENEPTAVLKCDAYSFISEPRKLGYRDASVLVNILSENERINGTDNHISIELSYQRNDTPKVVAFEGALKTEGSIHAMLGEYASSLAKEGNDQEVFDEGVAIIEEDLPTLKGHADMTELERDAIYTRQKLEERFKNNENVKDEEKSILPYLEYVEQHCKEQRVSLNKDGKYSMPMNPNEFLEKQKKEEVKEQKQSYRITRHG